ncbi:MAG TPA: response regulator transcription factor [Chloroflexota bacterium]|nr:response regulator transcription factor [Chloroflexota bacterium]
MAKHTVLIADDHAVYRMGLRDLLEPEFKVISEATEGAEAVMKAQQHKPDVVVMDINMPGLDGISAAKQIRQSCPDTGVVVITAYDDDRRIFEAIQAGAAGYVLKDDDPQTMIQAIDSAAQGKAFLPPLIVKRVLDGVAGAMGGRMDNPERSITPLSNREVTVLRLMAEGKRNREIAKDLSISERTVGNHITNIYNKLSIYDRSQAVVYAIKKGLVRI